MRASLAKPIATTEWEQPYSNGKDKIKGPSLSSCCLRELITITSELKLFEGNSWSGLHSWITEHWTGTDGKTYSNATLFTRDNFKKAGITDLSKILINVHQYLDSDYSGTHDTFGERFMNINELFKQANCFCDEIESLAKEISNTEFEHFDKVSQTVAINDLDSKLKQHKLDLTHYCKMYQIPEDEYLMSLLDRLMGFLSTAVDLLKRNKLTSNSFELVQEAIATADVCVYEEDYSAAFKKWRKEVIKSDRLNKYKKELKAARNPLVVLIGEKLSPSKTYLRPTILNTPALQNTQTYYRSEMHPVSKQLKEKNHVLYLDKKLVYGARRMWVDMVIQCKCLVI